MNKKKLGIFAQRVGYKAHYIGLTIQGQFVLIEYGSRDVLQDVEQGQRGQKYGELWNGWVVGCKDDAPAKQASQQESVGGDILWRISTVKDWQATGRRRQRGRCRRRQTDGVVHGLLGTKSVGSHCSISLPQRWVEDAKPPPRG